MSDPVRAKAAPRRWPYREHRTQADLQGAPSRAVWASEVNKDRCGKHGSEVR